MDTRKQLFITTVRTYLQNNKISFVEYETMSGSHYFHINLNNKSNPCVRISNHKSTKSHCLTLLYNMGLNTKTQKIKTKINNSLTNMISRANRYSVWKTLEELDYGRKIARI